MAAFDSCQHILSAGEECRFTLRRPTCARQAFLRKDALSLCLAITSLFIMLGVCADLPAQGDALRRGISLMRASQPTRAEQVFASIPPSDADYVSARTLLGYLYLARSALSQAEEAFRTALSADADDPTARLGLGMALVRKGSPAQAVTELQTILKDPSVGTAAKVQWIQSMFLDGRIDDAFNEASRLSREHSSVAELHNLLGFLLQVRGETAAALHEYLDSVELDPDNPATYYALISTCRGQGDYEAALRWARRAMELEGDNPLLYQELAGIYEKLGRSEEASAAGKTAGRMVEAELLFARAAKARSAGRTREAESLLRESTNRNPRLVKAWIELGNLLLRAGLAGEARPAFQHALEISPGDARAVAGLTAALQSEGRESEALRFSREAVARGTASPDLLTGMAAIYGSQGRPADAETAVLQAIRQLPDNPELLSYLGYLRQSTGKTQEALDSYARALRLDPRQVDALAGQARSLLLQGDTNWALASIARARSLDPKNTALLKEQVEVYRKAGNPALAQSSCRECLAISPADFECREQLASLKLEGAEYREAAAQYQAILRSGISTRSVLEGLSFALMKMGNYERAIKASEDALRQFGPDERVYAGLGYLYRCRGDLKAAIRNYRAARDLAASNPERNFDLGLALYLDREYADAVAPLEAAIRLKPDSGDAHYYLAVTYWSLGQRVLALAYARRAQELGVPAAKAVVQSLANALSLPPRRIENTRRYPRE